MTGSPKRVRFEVLPDGRGGWAVTRDSVVIEDFHLKDRAVQHARARAREVWRAGTPSQLLVKGRNGRIQDERTYGNDPRHIPG